MRFTAPKTLPLALLPLLSVVLSAQPAFDLVIDTGSPGKAISRDLVGIFFEDLNYAADGGLYAELIQNRSFEYGPLDHTDWNSFTSWDLVARSGKGSLVLDGAFPLHPNNPHYAVLEVTQPGEIAMVNAGFDGIPVQAGEKYDLTVFTRYLYTGGRWDAKKSSDPLPLIARLETREGVVLAEISFTVTTPDWTRFSASFAPSASCVDARLVLIARDRGGFAVDEVSLFPKNTFKGRANGLRADLAQTIADLKPRFMRFPGGCLVHGNGLPNFYRWKDTIGPVEQRRHQSNLWGYHQSVGLGYYEFFQFCEDLGALPLPVVPAAVSCQNSGHTGGTGQQCLPLADLPAYIQDLCDLIEWANGPASSPWGAKRAAAGHPAPFGLKLLGVGNEDHITPGFRERFRIIHDALREKHPEITLIGTAGPAPDGEDFEQGWKFANELKVAMVDEHYYKSPQWFWDNLARYDAYDRTKSKVYLGEYAAHDNKRRTTLRAALAEAAYLTSLERNGDIVTFASYAPLLAKRGHTQWNPNLIYFTNTGVFPTISYQVQRLFALNAGDHVLATSLKSRPESTAPADLAVSSVRDSHTGDLILKVVSAASEPLLVHLVFKGATILATTGSLTVLTATDPSVSSDFDHPDAVLPAQSTIPVSAAFDLRVPPHSLTILRLANP